MKPKNSDALLEKGLLEAGASATDNGAIWDTFLLDGVAVQAPKPGDGNRVSKSSFLYEHLSENGVPVPDVHSKSEEPPAYGVYERIDGTELSELKNDVSRLAYLEAVESAGEALARIHNSEGFGYGYPLESANYKDGSHDTWNGFVADRQENIENFVSNSPFQPVVEKATRHLEPEEVPEKPDSSVLHNDYHDENILVDGSLNAHVIDLDNAYYGDARFDLIRSEAMIARGDEDARDAFRRGYSSVRDYSMSQELEEQYTALAILQGAEAGEWTRRNRDSEIDEWVNGLQNRAESL